MLTTLLVFNLLVIYVIDVMSFTLIESKDRYLHNILLFIFLMSPIYAISIIIFFRRVK